MQNKDIQLLYVDLFCGAGGTSTGVESATINGQKCAKVIACVNHDANAIASHAANHPDALHFTEDIRTLDLTDLIAHVALMRLQYPNAILVLWASLECTNHSKAKGGMSRDADSRTLANHLFRYIKALRPELIQIENVVEFIEWGPLKIKVVCDKNGNELYCPLDYKKVKNKVVACSPVWVPIPELKGTYYNTWIGKMKKCGYNFDYKVLNSADFGAYTARKRYFGQFAGNGLRIEWPKPTHKKRCESEVKNKAEQQLKLFHDTGNELKCWNPVKEVLDFSDEGESIFDRNPSLVEKTLERIYAGLIKFVAGGKKAFIQQRNSGNPYSKIVSLDGPARTITQTGGNQELVQAKFLASYYSSGDNCSSIENPSPTVTTKDRLSIIQPKFLCTYNFKDAGKDINQPCPTLLTKDRLALVQPQFIDQQYGKSKPASVNNPLGSITVNPKYNLVTNVFLDMQYSNGTPMGVDVPAGVLTTTPKQKLITCNRWVMNTNFGNVGSSVDEPAQTITANRKWHYLMNPQYLNNGGSVDAPCFTLIARMDKMPPYLIEVEGGRIGIEIYDTDSYYTRKIKEFMAMYGIIDIKMRMLRIDELKLIMGFPHDYRLIGTQADQKKFIGNAVEVNMAKALARATATSIYTLREHHKKQIA